MATKKIVRAEAFIKVWMAAYRGGHPTPWVADTLKLPLVSTHGRAKHYRDRGVNLPKLVDARRGVKKLDVDELNNLIGEL